MSERLSGREEEDGSDDDSFTPPSYPLPASSVRYSSALPPVSFVSDGGLKLFNLPPLPNSPPQALPAGWTTAQDEGGNAFYWNADTGETTWERPVVLPKPPPRPPPPLPPLPSAPPPLPLRGGHKDPRTHQMVTTAI